MTIVETLKKAREIISDPSRWTTKVFARNAAGDRVPASSSEAVCFCASGAIAVVTDGVYSDGWRCAVSELERDTGDVAVANVNDREGHEAVLALFDKTIARLES